MNDREATLTAELDQARFEIEALQRKLNEYYSEVNRLREKIADRESNNEAVKEMAATLPATTQDCAALREALEWVHMGSLCADPATAASSRKDCPICAALALGAGKGYVPQDKARQLAECLQHIKKLALECREKPEVVLSAVGLSACAGVGIAEEISLISKNPS